EAAGTSPIGAKIPSGSAPRDSLHPCGGGMGVGGRAVSHRRAPLHDPQPPSPPHKGRGGVRDTGEPYLSAYGDNLATARSLRDTSSSSALRSARILAQPLRSIRATLYLILSPVAAMTLPQRSISPLT